MTRAHPTGPRGENTLAPLRACLRLMLAPNSVSAREASADLPDVNLGYLLLCVLPAHNHKHHTLLGTLGFVD